MHLNNFLSSLPLLAIATGRSLGFVPRENHRKTCAVHPAGSESVDDATAVLEAFRECGHGGRVVFSNTTYHINSVMNTTRLKDCQVDIYGTLLWGTNITYWLNHSLPVGYQNQSTAWVFGGENVRFNGHGYGTLNGNGQAWYDFVGDVSNYPGRPHALTVAGASKSVFEGLRFVQSQMWTLSVIQSDHLLFDSIYVNNTSSSGSAQNTDGGDTIASSHITFNNWTIDNGDDSLSTKANSTDILIANSTFYRGLGIAVGSIGQYKGIYETVERVRAENITYQGTLHAVYYKTWTGEQVGYPPNGGGGGLGHASDMTFSNLKVYDLQGPAVAISQCTSFSDQSGNCTSSKFQIRDLSFSGISGSSSTDVVASLQCSAVKSCEHVEVDAASLDIAVNGANVLADEYLCGNVDDPIGFDCTGDVCVGSSATGGCSEHQIKDRTKALTR